jgi:hypothetical protein
MKQLFILIFSLFTATFGISQNAYFVPFHTDYNSLYKQLSKAREMTLEEEGQQDALIARQLHSEVSYRFHQDSIYRIEVKNDYFKRKDAEAAYNGCREYFRKIWASETAFSVQGNDRRIIAIKGGNSYELTYTEYSKSYCTVSLAVKCVRFMPEEEMSDSDYMADR